MTDTVGQGAGPFPGAALGLRPRGLGRCCFLLLPLVVVAVILFLPMYSFAPGQGRGAHMTDVTPWGEEVDMRWRTGALAGMLLLLVMRPRSGERWLP